MARCAIGIDLGTSNCALEWCELKGRANRPGEPVSDGNVSTFKIRQYETPDRVVESDVLPSFVYFHQDPKSDEPYHVGLYARESLKDDPARCIHSAKSWLCHSGIDRESSILPWQSSALGASQKLSPVEASAAYLRYLKASWDAQFADKGPDYAFAKQQVTVTVPASFDQVAQRLTLQAAKEAGFPESTRLLEEPQAAFLAWIQSEENRVRLQKIQSEKGAEALSIVVCDVGGGTTDFSLFKVSVDSEGEDPIVERIAVSDHILLGGDNIDIALAKRAEAEWAAQGHPVKPEQWLQLVAQARLAKEAALGSETSGSTLRITLVDTGSSIFANTRSLEWERDEIASWISEHFFPQCEASSVAQKDAGGFVELGLPYSHEAAVTVHLAEFLSDHKVDAILFNGGTVSSDTIQKRIADIVASWQRDGSAPDLLSGQSPYLAVARGAAFYGQRLKAQSDTLIRAGASRPFLIEVQANEKSDERHLLCLVPKGATPADSFTIKKPTFALRLNRPVQFQPFSGPDTDRMRQGQIVKWKPDQFRPMPPLQTLALSGEKLELGASDVSKEVILNAKMNELGLIEVECVATEKRKKETDRWGLAFDVRQVLASENQLAESQELNAEFFEKSTRFQEILSGNFSERVLKELEGATDQKRSQWELPLLRKGFDTLMDRVSSKGHSEAHEAAWWMAAGYCLRPGFGAPLDDFRIRQLDPLFEFGLAYSNSKSVNEQNAVFWRRVAGGLNAEMQERVFKFLENVALSGTKKGLEPLKALAAMERLSPSHKKRLMEFLVPSLVNAPRWAVESYAWCLGRVCARIPLSASQEHVLPHATVSPALVEVFEANIQHVPTAHLRSLLLQASRISGVRDLDLDTSVREQLTELAAAKGVDRESLKPLMEYVPLVKAERQVQYGEALPQGLILV
ncbi:MAG: Hsp70 family protein [Opitutales bacterium]